VAAVSLSAASEEREIVAEPRAKGQEGERMGTKTRTAQRSFQVKNTPEESISFRDFRILSHHFRSQFSSSLGESPARSGK